MRYVALLRAINVGGHVVKMERLRTIFASLGFRDVETVIASGNVVFAAGGKPPALEVKIERALRDELGYDVATFLRCRDELEDVVSYDPLPHMAPAQPDHVLSVVFLKEPPTADAGAALLSLRNDVDDFVVRGRDVYWLRRTKAAPSLVAGPRFERALQRAGTGRNITTVRKLAQR
ncbi:MAG: DUF1697 domain-containing protein, partial [Gemmatimonadota bacterium]